MELSRKVSGEARRFRAGLDAAAEIQSHVLKDILTRNAGCEYGRRHGFDHIHTHAQFQRSVPRYVLLLDADEVVGHDPAELSVQIDAALERNPQYAYARSMGQLGALRPVLCHRPMDSFQADALSQGRRLGDVKPPALYTAREWRRTFNIMQS